MKKIGFLAVAVLLTIFAAQCADQLLSQEEKPEYYSKSMYGSKLQELEARLRELGWIQSGIVTVRETRDFSGYTMGYVDLTLESSYQNTNYSILITPRDIPKEYRAIPLSSNSFRIVVNSIKVPYDVSWLTIGQ